MIELADAIQALNNCMKEITEVKTFLEDENCWWRILKNREITCCELRSPHLHGCLDGVPVTLKLLEESEEAGTSKSVLKFVTCDSERKRKDTEQFTNSFPEKKEYVDRFTEPCQNMEPQRKQCTAGGSERKTVGETSEPSTRKEPVVPKIPEGYSVFRGAGVNENFTENTQAREVRHRQRTSQTEIENNIKSRETFSSENMAGRKYIAADLRAERMIEKNFSISRRKLLPRGLRSQRNE